jgi:hypothetical protein
MNIKIYMTNQIGLHIKINDNDKNIVIYRFNDTIFVEKKDYKKIKDIGDIKDVVNNDIYDILCDNFYNNICYKDIFIKIISLLSNFSWKNIYNNVNNIYYIGIKNNIDICCYIIKNPYSIILSNTKIDNNKKRYMLKNLEYFEKNINNIILDYSFEIPFLNFSKKDEENFEYFYSMKYQYE